MWVCSVWAAVAYLLEALCYLPKVAGLIPVAVADFIFFNFILPAALWLWGLTQPLTEMSTRNLREE
jgi:hypothetical protein